LRHNEFDVADLIDIKNTPTWSDGQQQQQALWHENETLDKATYNGINPEGIDDDERAKILKKKSSPSYYAPLKKQKQQQQQQQQNTKKYYVNGKPKSFYVMRNEQKSYHNLID